MNDNATPWEMAERDDGIEGWKIMLSGYRGAFHVMDRHLKDLDLTLDEYINWLRIMYPHRDTKLDS